MFSVVILFHHWFPLLEKFEISVFILPRNFPAVLIIFTGRVGAGNPPLPTVRGGAGNPPSPRPSLVSTDVRHIWLFFDVYALLKKSLKKLQPIRRAEGDVEDDINDVNKNKVRDGGTTTL